MNQLSLLDRIVRFCLEQKLIVILLAALIVGWGVAVAPFPWELRFLPRSPVPVDAIPNLGENQQIVATDWPGRSPQDVEDQVTYPLTVALMGVPGVKEVRSQSMFGFSSIYLIFDDDVDFHWARGRIIEKLSSLPAGTLPDDARPSLGPDATGLGQIFWYTLEGRDPEGNPLGGWDLHELRTVQDWYVRYGLMASEGIAEVASIGGHVQEYQIDVDPDAMRAHNVTLQQVFTAIHDSNLDVGARVTEINNVEYIVRGRGFVQSLSDLEQAVVRVADDQARMPVRIKDVAVINIGPAQRRGAITHAGAEAVGGVVVVREGYNPLAAIGNVKEKISEISPGLPAKAVADFSKVSPDDIARFAAIQGFEGLAGAALNQDAWLTWLRSNPRQAWPDWINISQLEIVPFYDRTHLINETLGTLNDALLQQILITVIVVIVMVMHLRTAMVVSFMLPMAVLMTFIAMKLFGVDSNVVSLAGIAIAIGTIVDMGIIVCENVLNHLRDASPDEPRLNVVFRAAREVSSAVVTAISTTVISFLPVFFMTGAEGKMFIPLAWTKTFVLLASVIIALMIVPAAAHVLLAGRINLHAIRRSWLFAAGLISVFITTWGVAASWWWVAVAGLILLALVIYNLLQPNAAQAIQRALPNHHHRIPQLKAILSRAARIAISIVAAALVTWWLTETWEPIGPELGLTRNYIFVGGLIGSLLVLFLLFQLAYGSILRWALDHKALFLSLPLLLCVTGATVWFGFDRVFGFVPTVAERVGLDGQQLRQTRAWSWLYHEFPGLGRQFMPSFDEGSFLWMPSVMPHGSIGQALAVLQYQDLAIASVPEIDTVAGKIGRVESALDPAPVGMIESIITYKPQYITDEQGRRINFKFDQQLNQFVRDANGDLIEDPQGRPFRQWREHIRSPRDIWDELAKAAHIPGATSAPLLMPIETRQVMIQSGMSAPMGVKVRGPDMETLDRVAIQIQSVLREVPAINPGTVNADRAVAKPYLQIEIDRQAIARYGLSITDVQNVISVAIGGREITTTVEGRQRYPVRVRYLRELRDDIDAMQRVLLATPDGAQIPLSDVATIQYVRGPDMIKSEDTFPVSYITFGAAAGWTELEVVDQARQYLQQAIASGKLNIPAGVSYRFAGMYEHQVRAAATLRVVLPLALASILIILYLQFRRLSTALIILSGIAVAWAGGFLMIWLYGQDWFANFDVFSVNMRELFQFQPIALSVAVWVGFLALFGIAVDDGIVMATYLQQRFDKDKPASIKAIRQATITAGLRRVRPCLMTSATTILALLPVLASTGRGSDIMIPMAIPTVGGMSLVLLTMFTVPVLYCLVAERQLRTQPREQNP